MSRAALRRAAMAAALALFAGPWAAAQGDDMGMVSVTSDGRSEAPAAAYVYRLTFERRADTAEAAFGLLGNAEADVLEQLGEAKLIPKESGTERLQAARTAEGAYRVRREVWLRYSAEAFGGGTENLSKLGLLTDTVGGIAAKLDAAMAGPEPKAAEPQAHERAAIARALEKSLPLAEAAVQSMNARVLAVGRIELVSVSWGAAAPDADGAEPISLVPVCTAEIDVSYAYGPNY